MSKNPTDECLVHWTPLRKGALPPAYGSEEAAGADLYAHLDMPVVLQPGERHLIPTGIAIELAPGHYAKIESRSGIALRAGVHVIAGVIDSDYRGEVGVVLLNSSKDPFTIHHGDRIAQMITKRYSRATFLFIEALEASERGTGGFGSTGV